MFDLVGLGSILVDCTTYGVSNTGRTLYECNPGGSVANFLVAAARGGANCAFIGKVGRDMFGELLYSALDAEQIDLEGMMFSDFYQTACSFVKLNDHGEREFIFYHTQTADSQLKKDDISFSIIDNARALHITSLILSSEQSREACLCALAYAKDKNKLITFDVNWRRDVWENKDIGLRVIKDVIKYCDIVKVSEEEAAFLTGNDDIHKAAKTILNIGTKLVIITVGEKGSYFFHNDESGYVPAYSTKVVDTTGAGDCHFGSFVSGFLLNNLCINSLDNALVISLLQNANKAAAVCINSRGGIPPISKNK